MSLRAIVYIVGYGHSGSTIVGGSLATDQSLVWNAGAVWPVPNFFPRSSASCSCGEKVSECSFWNGVKTRYEEYSYDFDFTQLKSLAPYWEDERLSVYQRLLREARCLRRGRITSYLFERYRFLSRAFFNAIADEASAEIIVDSSKNVSRGFARLLTFPEYYVVHLIRNVKGVVISMKKPMILHHENDRMRAGRSAVRTALGWTLRNLQSLWLIHQSHQTSMTWKLESFTEAPLAHVQEFDRYTKLPIRSDVNDIVLASQHIAAGNPLRQKNRISIEKKHNESLPLCLIERISIELIARSLYKFLGY
jgi:hypothetical protein